MKKILTIIIINIFCFGNAYSKDLTGTKIKCTLASMETYLEFTSYDQVVKWDFMPSAIKYWKWNNFYRVNIKNIEFSWMKNFEKKEPSSLNRETLQYGSFDCELIADGNKFDIENYLEEQIQILTENQKKKNKI
tara:strand:+ start:48 stop:449 length:402 start_codon:yes stop_codon:yes gene_type:complete